ncbi:lipopolysaccharide biosynthesis protein [Robiginitalea sp. IMCC43444]|uniref:lipopolysaccharide biosynthesis protein n=1 Tax=Robiginitalea sp. IMCC43444 TaxID=3459121 RepID=UPI004042242C
MNRRALKNIRNNSIFKNLLVYFVSSVSAIFITVLLQFILPKLITIEEYGLYKTFTLYLSFTSLLHFGLKDGIYLRISEQLKLNLRENGIYFSTVILQQLGVFAVMFIIGFFFQGVFRYFFFALAASSFFFILNTYYDSLYQSRKEFKVVSFLKIFKEAILLTMVGAFFLLQGELSLEQLLLFFTISICVTFIIYTLKARPFLKFAIPSKEEIRGVVFPVYRRGVGLLAGNFGNQINSNIDKLFVSSFLSVSAFAYYSFGGLFFVLTNTLVGSVSTVLLPYLLTDYKDKLNSTYRRLLDITTIFGLLLFIYVLTVQWIVFEFYPEYNRSIPIISLFFGAMVYNMKINIIQNNYLKTLRLDGSYVRNNYLILALFLAVLFAIFFWDGDLQWYAMGTSFFVFSRYKLNQYSLNKKMAIPLSPPWQDTFLWSLAIVLYFLTNWIYT